MIACARTWTEHRAAAARIPCVTVSTSLPRIRRSRRLVCQVTCANSANFRCPGLLMRFAWVARPRAHGPGFKNTDAESAFAAANPAVMPRGSRNQPRTEIPARALPAQLFHQLLQLRPRVPPSRQEREQPPPAGGCREIAELAGPLRGDGAGLYRGIDALVLERLAHRVLGDCAVYALRQEVRNEPRRPLTAWRTQGGVLLGEAAVVDQAARPEPVERGVDGLGRVLLLDEAAAQVVPGVGAPRQRAQRRTVRRLDVGQVAEPGEHRGRQLGAQLQRRAQRVERGGGEG